MDDYAFGHLLEKIRSRIGKRNTMMRDVVTAEERLVATLIRYLAAENSLQDLKYVIFIE